MSIRVRKGVVIDARVKKKHAKARELEQSLNEFLAKVKQEIDRDLSQLISQHPDLVFRLYDENPNLGTVKDLLCAALLESIHQYKALGCKVVPPVSDRSWPSSVKSAKNIRALWMKIGVTR